MNTILFFILLALATWFAVTNADAVGIDLFLWHFDVSLAIVVCLAFIAGFAAGMIRVMPDWFNKRNHLLKTTSQLAKAEQERDELKKLNESLHNSQSNSTNTPEQQN